MVRHLLLLSPPVSAAGRNFYPLVRVSHLSHPSGGWLSAEPVALIIEEGGVWSFASLEDGIGEEALSAEMIR